MSRLFAFSAVLLLMIVGASFTMICVFGMSGAPVRPWLKGLLTSSYGWHLTLLCGFVTIMLFGSFIRMLYRMPRA